MPLTREQFKAAILQGGNPEGPYDIDPQERAEVLAEIGTNPEGQFDVEPDDAAEVLAEPDEVAPTKKRTRRPQRTRARLSLKPRRP